MRQDEATATRRRVLIVDDHPVMRAGLAAVIGQQSDLEVCGEAGDAAGARDLVARLKPDLALVDISLPGEMGLELVREFASRRPTVACLIVTVHEETRFAVLAMRAGARGYVNKRQGAQALVGAMRQVLAGGIYLDPGVAGRLVAAMVNDGSRARQTDPPALTTREQEVMRLLGHGLDARAIAESLGLSVKTVEVHKSRIKRKLGLPTTIQLHQHALRLIQDDLDR